MSSSSPLLLTLFTLLLLSPLTSANFIYDICRSTKHLMVCYHSLVPYADTIGNDHGRLLEIAISSILFKSKKFSSFLTRQNITEHSTSGDPQVVQALHFCVDMYREVTVQFQLANSFIHQRRRYNKDDLRSLFCNDLDRSISDALAQEIQCNDAWKDAADSPIKADISRRTLNMSKFTQNAKDLLAAYAKQFLV